MMKLVHSFLRFIWSNLIGILSWLWLIWVTASLLDMGSRLDKLEKQNGLILEWILMQGQDVGKLKQAPNESDTSQVPYGNSDRWKGLNWL